MTQPEPEGQPEKTDNAEREGIDPVQDVSQDPEVRYDTESL